MRYKTWILDGGCETLEVRPVPWWWNLVSRASFTFEPVIYLQRTAWDDIENSARLIQHEHIHLERQKGRRWRWLWNYIRHKSFRAREEVLAYAHEYLWVEPSLRAVWLDEVSTRLASGFYYWCISKQDAEQQIKAKAKDLAARYGLYFAD